LAAAYDVGRLLARFVFHAQQAELGIDDHPQHAREVLYELKDTARGLRDVPDRRGFQARLARVVDEYVRRFETEFMAESVHLLWSEEVYDPALDGDPSASLESTVWPALEAADRLWELLRQGTGDREVLAMELGEVVEEGVCPRPVAPQCFRKKEGFIHRRGREPGEHAPADGWERKVRRLAAEVGVEKLVSLSPPLEPADDGGEGVDVRGVVDGLHTALRGALASTDAGTTFADEGVAALEPEQGTRPRGRGDARSSGSDESAATDERRLPPRTLA
jgi:hypothetical protein